MMKSLILASCLLFAAHGFAAVETPELSNDEIQKELNELDETMEIDKSDEEFLETKTAEATTQKDGVYWGRAIEAQRAAQAPATTTKKR